MTKTARGRVGLVRRRKIGTKEHRIMRERVAVAERLSDIKHRHGPDHGAHGAARKQRQDAVAVGAAAVGATAIGALAVGAVAVGSFAIGRLVVRGADIRRMRIRELAVDQLTVSSLQVMERLG